MKYSDLFTLNPIESVIQIDKADKKNEAQQLVERFVITPSLGEAMRRNALLRLFREYTNAKGPLKVFRKEAVPEGFRHCWETQQYGVIVAVCEKIPEKILQEIQDFVMMYDVAKDAAPTMEPQTAFVWE